jgi:hypothetical protein
VMFCMLYSKMIENTDDSLPILSVCPASDMYLKNVSIKKKGIDADSSLPRNKGSEESV